MASLSPSIVWFIVSFLIIMAQARHTNSKCVFINFGDSNTDTGNHVASTGDWFGPPFGQAFNNNGYRATDGRVYIDFLCESLGINYLSPYLQSVGSNFSHGVNFAAFGAAARIHLPMEVKQFGVLLKQTKELKAEGRRFVISEDDFQKAVYSIDIGHNDIAYALSDELTYEQVLQQSIPLMVESIGNATENLYKLGARKFLIYNTGPLGCLAGIMAMAKDIYKAPLDKVGCLKTYNNACKAFNQELKVLCKKMRSQMKDAVIVYIDMYRIKYDLFANPHRHGLEHPLRPCFDIGPPPYNESSKPPVCPHPERAVNWDGLHLAQAANNVTASLILSGKYSTPAGIKLKSFCRM